MQSQIDERAYIDCLKEFARRGRAIREARQQEAAERESLGSETRPAAGDPAASQRQDHKESTP
jgi:hypothetical protein